MRYVLANAEKAVSAGFDKETHNIIDGKMVITEKGMMQSSMLSGEVDERLSQLDGQMFDSARDLEFYLYNKKRSKGE